MVERVKGYLMQRVMAAMGMGCCCVCALRGEVRRRRSNWRCRWGSTLASCRDDSLLAHRWLSAGCVPLTRQSDVSERLHLGLQVVCVRVHEGGVGGGGGVCVCVERLREGQQGGGGVGQPQRGKRSSPSSVSRWQRMRLLQLTFHRTLISLRSM